MWTQNNRNRLLWAIQELQYCYNRLQLHTFGPTYALPAHQVKNPTYDVDFGLSGLTSARPPTVLQSTVLGVDGFGWLSHH